MADTFSSLEIFSYESFKSQVVTLSEYLKKLEGIEFERCCFFLENTLRPHLEKGKEVQCKINNCNGLEHQINYLSDSEKQLTIGSTQIPNFDNDDQTFTDKLLNEVGDDAFLPDSLLVNNSLLEERNPKDSCQNFDKNLSSNLKFSQEGSVVSDDMKYELNFKDNGSLNYIDLSHKTNSDISLGTQHQKTVTTTEECLEQSFESRSDIILNLCSKNKINLKDDNSKIYQRESNNITEEFDSLSYHITGSNILLEERLLDKNDSNSSIPDISAYNNSKNQSHFSDNIGLTKIFVPNLITNNLIQDNKENKKSLHNKNDCTQYISDVESSLSLNGDSSKACFKISTSDGSPFSPKTISSDVDNVINCKVDRILNLKKQSPCADKDIYLRNNSPQDSSSSLNLSIYSIFNSLESTSKTNNINLTQVEKYNENSVKALNLVNKKSKINKLPDKSSHIQSITDKGNNKQELKLLTIIDKSKDATTHSSKLINHNPVTCLKCRIEFPDISLWEEHEKSCGKNLFCNHCEISFKTKFIYFKHLANHKRNTCPHCSDTFISNQLLKNHMKVFHGINLVSKTFPCQYCSRVFMKRSSIYYHLQTHALPNQKVCPKCGKFINGEESYKEHMADHVKNAALQCYLCDAIFDRCQQYKDHMEGHKKYVCAYCKNYTSFSSKKLLFKHYKTEHPDLPSKINLNEKKYSCDQCPRVFARPSLLQDHKLTHTENKRLECRICNIQYAQRSNLKKHIRKVHPISFDNDSNNKNRHACQECGFTYSSISLLNKHCVKAHNSHSCSYCDYKTKHKHLLKRHLSIHIGKKNYLCDICGSMFHSASALKHHTLFLHSNERSFKCKQCDKSFKKKSCLSRHHLTHSTERPYKCECGSCYKQLSHLSRHISNAHNKKSGHRKVKKLLLEESKDESGGDGIVENCSTTANNSPINADSERTPQNDILLASSNAVLMTEETVPQDTTPLFTVLDSQLIQLIPSTLQLNQDGVQTVSLVNGELHTFSLAPPTYQLCQGESFSTTSTDPIIIHTSNSETTSTLALEEIHATGNSNSEFTDDKLRTNESSHITLGDGNSLPFESSSLQDLQYRENVVDTNEPMQSLSTTHYLAHQGSSHEESPTLSQDLSNNSITIF